MNSRDQQIKLYMALQEKDRRKNYAPLLHFEPHEGQIRATQAVMDHRVVVLVTGNRFGKSMWNAALVVAGLYGYFPWLVPDLSLTEEGDYPPIEDIPGEYWFRRADGAPIALPAHGLVVTGLGLLQGIGSVMWPKIEEFLPPRSSEPSRLSPSARSLRCPHDSKTSRVP